MKNTISLPPGFYFRPDDDVLISHYLSNKIKGLPLPCNLITECDLYGDKPPWEICHGRKQEDCYFFTKLKKASKNRIARTAGGGGEWHGNARGKKIFDSKTKKIIGLKKQFSFKSRKGAIINTEPTTGWIMHEYSMIGSDNNSDDGYVLCHILKHHRVINDGEIAVTNIVEPRMTEYDVEPERVYLEKEPRMTEYDVESERVYLEKGWFYDVDPVEIERMEVILDQLWTK